MEANLIKGKRTAKGKESNRVQSTRLFGKNRNRLVCPKQG